MEGRIKDDLWIRHLQFDQQHGLHDELHVTVGVVKVIAFL